MADQFLALVEQKRTDIEQLLGEMLADEKKRIIAQTIRAITNPESHISASTEQGRTQIQKIRVCSDESKLQVVMDACVTRLVPGTVEKLAYLIPYGDQLTLTPDYKGLIKIAVEDGIATNIYAEVVYEKDVFRVTRGTMPALIHEPHLFGDRGKLLGAYAVAFLPDGGTDFEVLEMSDLLKMEEASKRITGGKLSPARSQWPNEMHKKGAIKRLVKRLKGKRRERLNAAVALEPGFDIETTATPQDDIPVATDGTKAPTPRKPKGGVEVVPDKPKEDRLFNDQEQNDCFDAWGALGGKATALKKFLEANFSVDDLAKLKLSQMDDLQTKMQAEFTE